MEVTLQYYFVNGDIYGYVPKLKTYMRFVSMEEYLEYVKGE